MPGLTDPVEFAGRRAGARVLFGPHPTNLGRRRALSDRHVAYYTRRAAGGTGIVVIETASVHPSDWPYERAPLATECGPGWSAIAGACHSHGALVLAGLGHRGGQGSSAYSQAALWATSRVAASGTREVEGKVAFVTGAARGQSRSHAVRLAEEGADIIAVDICKQIDTVPMPLASSEDLAETVKQVEALDRRIVATQADVRDYGALKAALDEGVAQLGRLDIVVANAGIASFAPADELTEETWQDMLDVNLTGVWHTCKAAIPHLKAGGNGGSIVLTSSAAGLKAYGNLAHYVSAKHGVVGLMRTLAQELAPHMIRVNSIHPTTVKTPMMMSEATLRLFVPDADNPTEDDLAPITQAMNALSIPWVEPVDISNAVLFLASEEARYITGVPLPVDAGTLTK
jgi:SDR family mycofactocin-dependent oxidoreductase